MYGPRRDYINYSFIFDDEAGAHPPSADNNNLVISQPLGAPCLCPRPPPGAVITRSPAPSKQKRASRRGAAPSSMRVPGSTWLRAQPRHRPHRPSTALLLICPPPPKNITDGPARRGVSHAAGNPLGLVRPGQWCVARPRQGGGGRGGVVAEGSRGPIEPSIGAYA
jgi:hypothetical protein